MRNYLKALGLALLAAFALSAVAAQGAFAQSLGELTPEVEANEVTLTGADTGEEANFFEAGGNRVECPDSTYTGHVVKTYEETSHAETTAAENEEPEHEGFLEKGATEFTVTPHYRQKRTPPEQTTANCEINGGELSATVTMNGCDYVFSDFTTIEGSEPYSFLADIVCPPEEAIEVHIYLGHGHSFSVCKQTITPQEGLEGGRAENAEGEVDDINLTGTVGPITINQSGFCGKEHIENAEYTLDVTVDAHEELGETEGITISDE